MIPSYSEAIEHHRSVLINPSYNIMSIQDNGVYTYKQIFRNILASLPEKKTKENIITEIVIDSCIEFFLLKSSHSIHKRNMASDGSIIECFESRLIMNVCVYLCVVQPL